MFICCFDAAKISIFFNKSRDKKGKMSVKTGKKPIFPILTVQNQFKPKLKPKLKPSSNRSNPILTKFKPNSNPIRTQIRNTR